MTIEKEKEAEAKFEALRMQVQLVRDFAVQLSQHRVKYKGLREENYTWH